MIYDVTLDNTHQAVSVIKATGGYQVKLGETSLFVSEEILKNIFKIHLIQKQGAEHTFSVLGQVRAIRIQDPRDYSLAGGNTAKASDHLRATIPGRIVKVCVNEGDAVKAGDPILVLEAMKMENELKASHDTTIAKIHVSAGQTVENNVILVTYQ